MYRDLNGDAQYTGIVLYCIVLYCIVFCIVFCIVLYCVLYCIVLYCFIFCIVIYYIGLDWIVLYCIGWTGYDCATPICTQAKKFTDNTATGDVRLGGYKMSLHYNTIQCNTIQYNAIQYNTGTKWFCTSMSRTTTSSFPVCMYVCMRVKRGRSCCIQ